MKTRVGRLSTTVSGRVQNCGPASLGGNPRVLMRPKCGSGPNIVGTSGDSGGKLLSPTGSDHKPQLSLQRGSCPAARWRGNVHPPKEIEPKPFFFAPRGQYLARTHVCWTSQQIRYICLSRVSCVLDVPAASLRSEIGFTRQREILKQNPHHTQPHLWES